MMISHSSASPVVFDHCKQDQGKTPWSLMQAEQGDAVPESIQLYLAEISAIPLLTPEQERTLALRVQQGDAEAKRQMLLANLRLVVHVARQYSSSDLPLMDQIQNGFFGLLTAVERFDPGRNLRLSTYAIWWIRQAIVRAQHNTTRLIRLPIYLQALIHCMDQASDRWFLTQGSEPTVEQLATSLGIPISRVRFVQVIRERTLSLDWSSDSSQHDGPTLADLIEDEQTPSPDEQICTQDEQETMHQAIRQALALLTERERQVISLRFGLDGQACQNFADIGRHLGVCRERVRQLLARALEKLRHAPRLQSFCTGSMKHDSASGWDWDGDEDNEGIASSHG